jgi:ADP-ribosylglycohydrolase
MRFVSNEALLILLALLAVFRAVLLDRRLQPLAACNGCVALLTFKHDAAVLGTVLLASALTHWVRASWVRALLRAFLCLVVAAYGLDVLIIVLYNKRRVVADFF